MDSGNNGPLSGAELSDRDALVTESASAILMNGGTISRVGDEQDLIAEFLPELSTAILAEMQDQRVHEFQSGELKVTHAGTNAVVPGLIDPHTHLLWAGDRSAEIRMRQLGKTYAEIAAAGGGIGHTVTQTRNASNASLLALGRERLGEAFRNGTTAMEAKSGYGLNTESELTLIELMQSLSADTTLPSIDPTWMGAHDAPLGPAEKHLRIADYVEELLSEQLPRVVEQGIARSCDVFCEPGWFDIEQTSDILGAAKEQGLAGRLHIDEFSDSGGAGAAADLNSETADHALFSNEEGRAAMAERGCIQGFLPGAPHTMGMDQFPPLEQCIEQDWPWTLATDFNPNCRILSLPFIASLAVQRCGIDPLAALASVTCNAATTVQHRDGVDHGVISKGAAASVNIVKGPSWEAWCLQPGSSPFVATVLDGVTVIH